MALDILRELFVKITMQGADEAAKGEQKLGKETDKTTKSMKEQDRQVGHLSQGLTRMGVFISSLAADLAARLISSAIGTVFRTITGFFDLMQKSVTAAGESEKAVNRLRVALDLVGDSSDETMRKFQSFADEMVRTTVVDDDAALGFLALAKNMGATNDQAMDIVRTAAEFSSVFGVDMDTAVQGLSKSLQGSVGTLGRALPILADFTEEQLKAGAAIQYVQKRYGGSAARQLNTYAGAFEHLQNIIGNALETIGGPLSKALVPAMGKFSNMIIGLMPHLEKFGEMMSQAFFAAVDGIESLLGIAGGGGNVIQKVGRFVLDIALWFEDLMLFLSGKDSYIGRLLGVKPGEGTIGLLLEKAFQGVLPKVIEWGFQIGSQLVVGLVKGLGTFYWDLLKQFANADFFKWVATELSNAIEMSLTALFGVDSWIVKSLKETPKENGGGSPIYQGSSIPTFDASSLASNGGAATYNNSRSDNRAVNIQNDIIINTPTPADSVQKQIDLQVFNAFTNVLV